MHTGVSQMPRSCWSSRQYQDSDGERQQLLTHDDSYCEDANIRDRRGMNVAVLGAERADISCSGHQAGMKVWTASPLILRHTLFIHT